MIKQISVTVTMLLFAFQLLGQEQKFWVFFKDKTNTEFDPYAYFDAKAIERRVLEGIALYDWYDLPVNESYINTLKGLGADLSVASRWLNAAVIYADETEINQIKKLDFVKEIIQSNMQVLICNENNVEANHFEINDEPKVYKQVELLGQAIWKEKKMSGKGIRICVNDVGFQSVNTNPVFGHLYKNNQIIKTYDFVDKDTNVYHGGWHGTAVLSCIAGYDGASQLGLANDAEFLLARTEYDKKEVFAEEEFWVAAAEWADKNGAQIINSSLGYGEPRYTQNQLDGKTIFITKAANIAARKGILVINAAGNEGSSGWRTLVAPADADSVLTVGGVTSGNMSHISFSSFGPSRDLRLKPNVCASGAAYSPNPDQLNVNQGTSFSTPLVSGFAACAWQNNRSMKSMELFKAIEKSGHLYPYFDYAHGYGVPQAAYFFNQKPEIQTEFVFEKSKERNALVIKVNKMKSNTNSVYYHIAKPNNTLRSYFVVSFDNYDQDDIKEITIDFDKLKPGDIVRVSTEGTVNEYVYN